MPIHEVRIATGAEIPLRQLGRLLWVGTSRETPAGGRQQRVSKRTLTGRAAFGSRRPIPDIDASGPGRQDSATTVH